MNRTVIIYGRERCHLCEEMWEDLQPLLKTCAHSLQIIDVDSDPQLHERFGLRVPVLMIDDEEICAGHLDIESAAHKLGNPSV